MATYIDEITTFGGRTSVLGTSRSFLFSIGPLGTGRGKLEIEGLTFEEARAVLRAIAGQQPRTDPLEELLTPAPGRTTVQKPVEIPVPTLRPHPTAPAPETLQQAAPARVPMSVTVPEPASEPEAAAASAPAESAPAADAAEPAPKRRGRPPKPRDENGQIIQTEPKPEAKAEPKPATNGASGGVGGLKLPGMAALQSMSGAPAPATVNGTAPADEPTDEPAEEPAPAPAPKVEPKPEPKPEPTPAAAPEEGLSTNRARQRAEQAANALLAKSEQKETNLVDDAEGEVDAEPEFKSPAAAVANTNAPATAVAKKANGKAPEGGWLLDPDNIPKELFNAKSLRALVRYCADNKVTDPKRITEECMRLEPAFPHLFRPGFEERLSAAIEITI